MSQSIICLPVPSYFVTTDADPTLVMVTNRLAGTLSIDAGEVAVWATTRPVYLLPTANLRSIAPSQFGTLANQHGCDALLAGRAVLGADEETLELHRIGVMGPRDFRLYRSAFVTKPVTTSVNLSPVQG